MSQIDLALYPIPTNQGSEQIIHQTNQFQVTRSPNGDITLRHWGFSLRETEKVELAFTYKGSSTLDPDVKTTLVQFLEDLLCIVRESTERGEYTVTKNGNGEVELRYGGFLLRSSAMQQITLTARDGAYLIDSRLQDGLLRFLAEVSEDTLAYHLAALCEQRPNLLTLIEKKMALRKETIAR